MSNKKEERPKMFKYYYKIINCDNPLLEGMCVSFREDNEVSAKKRAKQESIPFGPEAKVKFIKVV